jgi:PHD/YefM family antitoxin component YafN of YafNO toxin-antitoxin module
VRTIAFMNNPLIALESLPSQKSSQVQNKWGDVVRQVKDQGSLAITHHSTVELVLLTAGTYQSLLDLVTRLQARERSELDDLSGQFTARLESLQRRDSHDRLARVLKSKGKARKPPVAGKGY